MTANKMSEWQSYQKSTKEWRLTRMKQQLQLNKPYAYLFVDIDDLKEIKKIIKDNGYKIFYRNNLFFSIELFLKKKKVK